MAKDTIQFALSEETAENLEAALDQVKDYTQDGWTIGDIRIEARQEAGAEIKVGIIEVRK